MKVAYVREHAVQTHELALEYINKYDMSPRERLLLDAIKDKVECYVYDHTLTPIGHNVPIDSEFDVVDVMEINKWGLEAMKRCKAKVRIGIMTDCDPLAIMTRGGLEPHGWVMDLVGQPQGIHCYIAASFYWYRDNCHALVTRSAPIKDTLTNMKVPFFKIYTIPLPIDPNCFNISPINQGKWDKFKVLYVGRIDLDKGVEHAVRQYIRAFPRDDGKSQLTMIGKSITSPESYMDTVMGLIKDRQDIIMKGYLPWEDIVNEYATSDVFLHPQYFPMQFDYTYLEAMSSGLPIITINMGCGRDFVINAFNGYLCDSYNEIAEKLKSLKFFPQMREVMGRNSRGLVETKFTPQVCGAETLNLYNKLLN